MPRHSFSTLDVYKRKRSVGHNLLLVATVLLIVAAVYYFKFTPHRITPESLIKLFRN